MDEEQNENYLDHLAALGIIARLITDWDYTLGGHMLPTWVGPRGEAEAMSEREVRIIKGLLAHMNGRPSFEIRTDDAHLVAAQAVPCICIDTEVCPHRGPWGDE